MTPPIDVLARDLTTAVDTFDGEAAARICGEVVTGLRHDGLVVPAPVGNGMLGALRRKRYFRLMERLADALIGSAQGTPRTWRQYAQALIDQGKITAALTALDELVRRTHDDPTENAEAHGLLGRAFKQHYVQTSGTSVTRVQALSRATGEYLEVFERDRPRHLWPGINVVACVARAVRDGVPLPIAVDATALARWILEQIEARPASALTAFDLATAAEACVALAEWGNAARWLHRYVNAADCDAFEAASTLRQFREVWQLESGGPSQQSLLVLLQAALARKGEGAEVDLAPGNLQAGRMDAIKDMLEAQLGPDGVVPLALLRQGIELCRSVAHVTTLGGRSFGTAFVVRARDLREGASDDLLLLTNAHVVADDESVRARFDAPPLRSAEARLEFEISGKTHRIKRVLCCLPGGLDASLLSTDPPLQRVAPCRLEPSASDVLELHRRVYIIGHPGGGKLAFSLNDNVVIDFEDPRLHYRAPTARGSSGSPVFSLDWSVLALHRAGSKQMTRLNGGQGTYPANEGVWIHALKRALAKDWVVPIRTGRKRRSEATQ
jgi:hypothetical protein